MSLKYPRSLHVPFSPGASSDDKMMSDEQFEFFLNKEIVITEKLDGSNICLTDTEVFSRSHSGPATHKSFNLLKQQHAFHRCMIAPDVSIFAEWCFAVHSIKYSMLQSYLNIFGIRYDKTGEWASWDEVEYMAQEMRVSTVPVILRGVMHDKSSLEKLITEFSEMNSVYGPIREGLVIRTAEPLKVNKLNQLVGLGKWVRENHVTTTKHWKNKAVEVQPCILKI